jgi:hypothetical protein
MGLTTISMSYTILSTEKSADLQTLDLLNIPSGGRTALHARGGLAGAALGAEPGVRVREEANGCWTRRRSAHGGYTEQLKSWQGMEWTYV